MPARGKIMEVLFYSSVSSIFRSKRYDNYIILGKAHPLPPASGGNLIFVFLEAGRRGIQFPQRRLVLR